MQIDYRHPALGGCFGPGCLVSYGSDLVGDDFNGKNTPVPDPDPVDSCNGHGTHVAGIIAAQSNNPYGIIGAAQGVTLGAYRVFGCDGDVGNDVLIAAYLMAYEAGSDIITASIGGPSGWGEDPWAAVVSRIVEAGVPCVVSAGNDGATGIFYASTAANGKKVTAIASIDNTETPALLSNASYTVAGGPATAFGFTAGEPGEWPDVTLPLWTVSYNTSDPAHGCDPYPDDTPDLSDRIVLIRRGTCTFVQKITNAVAKGAKYVLFYNNVAGTVTVSGKVDGVEAVAMVTAKQGEEWVRAMEAGQEVVVTMTDPSKAGKFLTVFENTATPGYMSEFTSWGPTFEVDVKPQFGAPGGMILSTYPIHMGAYAVLSGTSMSCPMAAAIYALLMNVRGTKDPKTLENVLSAAAKPNFFRSGGQTPEPPLLAPVVQQGAGILQAWDAAHATTLLSVSSLSFNDTEHFVPYHHFSVSNTGKSEVTYKLGNVGAATAYTFAEATDITPMKFPGEITADFASLAFEPAEFTLAPGQRKVIKVTATPPKGVDVDRLPVWSGYVTINGTDGSNLSLPYVGVSGSLKAHTVLDERKTYLSRGSDEDNTPILSNDVTFLLPPQGFANDTRYRNGTELPKLVATLSFGSPLVRVDVVPLSNCTSVKEKATLVFGDTLSLGQPEGLPSLWNPRGTVELKWDGRLADGTYAPAGKYKLVVRALRVFGNPDEKGDYDVTETVEFKVRYKKTEEEKKLRRLRRRAEKRRLREMLNRH